MSSPDQSVVRNLLLQRLSAADFALLAPHLEPIDLKRGLLLAERGEPISQVCFAETGIVSQVAVTEENRRREVGIYGREGFGPTAMVAGVDRTPYEHFVQIEGVGFRIDATAFVDAYLQSASLHAVLLRFMQVFTIQTGYTALSNGSGVIGERLARWLLMCHDRIDGNGLSLTHEFLGIMLGVRRSGVTDAIHHLEGVGIIRAVRGHIEIRDRERLEDTAGDSYGVPEAEYARLLGSIR